jgi:MoxR-like ATPase
MNTKVGAFCDAVARTVKGKDDIIRMAIVTLIAEGHLLIEDVPGVGKTTLGHAMARALSCNFHRVQFTSDLLPSDVLGVSIFNPKTNDFEFKPGPIFSNIVLADEINRTTPKTQSALLEAMNENQVTIENSTHLLPRPFMVLATQNPAEHHGTYPLPESQLDRFLMKLEVGYPDESAEKEILKRYTNGNHKTLVEPVLGPGDVIALQEESRKVHIDEEIVDYMLYIVNSTRKHPDIELGVSPRGTVALFRGVQALSLVDGRNYAIPDDVKRLVPLVFGHRIMIGRAATKARMDPQTILRAILEEAPVPAEKHGLEVLFQAHHETQAPSDVEDLPPIDGIPHGGAAPGCLLFHDRSRWRYAVHADHGHHVGNPRVVGRNSVCAAPCERRGLDVDARLRPIQSDARRRNFPGRPGDRCGCRSEHEQQPSLYGSLGVARAASAVGAVLTQELQIPRDGIAPTCARIRRRIHSRLDPGSQSSPAFSGVLPDDGTSGKQHVLPCDSAERHRSSSGRDDIPSSGTLCLRQAVCHFSISFRLLSERTRL